MISGSNLARKENIVRLSCNRDSLTNEVHTYNMIILRAKRVCVFTFYSSDSYASWRHGQKVMQILTKNDEVLFTDTFPASPAIGYVIPPTLLNEETRLMTRYNAIHNLKYIIHHTTRLKFTRNHTRKDDIK